MKKLDYPFDSAYLLKKRKSLRRNLLSELETHEKAGEKVLSKRIAILGGSTTHDFAKMREIAQNRF